MIFSLLGAALFIAIGCGQALFVFADDGKAQLSEQIAELLKSLDLSELQKYLDGDKDNYLFNFGSTAKEIVEYLINGNLGTDYGGYLSELFSVICKNVINLVPAFATVAGVALLSAVITAAEDSLIGKSTSKIVHLACYSLIILIVSSMLLGII